MKAIVMHERGGPEVLRYEDFPTPEPGPDEVLVRVRASGLNHLDVFTRRGEQGRRVKLPHILGIETAGEVAALGDGVVDLQVGDRVISGPGIWCGRCEMCRAGEENMCVERLIVGVDVHGGYAEYIKLPAYALAPLPESISFEEGAATLIAFGTAWHMLVDRAALSPGETLLVLAAGSGVGMAAVQVGKYLGARIIATASTEDKLARARILGADETINYAQQRRFARAVRKLTDGRGADVVFEHVGTDTWRDSVTTLAIGGRLVTCGSTTGRWGETDLWSLFAKQATLLGSFSSTQANFRTVLQLVSEGKLRPVLDSILPLSEAAEAHRRLEARQVFGKIVLQP
ncbi:MAG: zinc-binding dehydrogenase [Anaerolineales bacterium]|nr:MAG: zinc-binding dehydrogenase [Anaerolineales bacterium]